MREIAKGLELKMRGAAVWLAGLGVAVLAWPIGFVIPAPGLDLSWMSGLYMAIDGGKDFGSEIVFTYGPLGFLSWPGLWFSWLALLAYAYSTLLYLAFAITLIWLLDRTIGLWGAAVVAFLFLVTLPDLEELPLLLAVGWSFAALRADRPAAALPVLALGGGLVCAIEPLVKLSVGPPTVLICLLGLAGARAERRHWLLFGATAVGGMLSLWLLSGQGLGGLWDYAVNGAEIVSGYSEAMGVEVSPAWQGVVLVASALALLAMVSRAPFRDPRGRWFALGLTAVAAFVLVKYGLTRFHQNAVSIALSGLVGIFLMLPWPRRRAASLIAVGAVVGAISFHISPSPGRLDVVDNLKALKDSAELALRPGLRQGRIDQARADLQATLAVPPEVLAAVKSKKVAIDPWEIAVAWAYELDWSPLPVFQGYSAYTPPLDRLNAAAVESPDGPEAILRADPGGTGPLGGSRSMEGRLPAWDPPAQNFATVCNFRPTLTVGTWQVLSRIHNRCGEPQMIASVAAEPGETVKVPQAGRDQLVLLRLRGIGVEGLERLRMLLLRPRPRFATLNDGLVTYRLVPGTGEDGMVVSRDPALDGKGAFEQLPEVETMSVDGVDRELRFDFYRVPTDSAGIAAGRLRPRANGEAGSDPRRG